MHSLLLVLLLLLLLLHSFPVINPLSAVAKLQLTTRPGEREDVPMVISAIENHLPSCVKNCYQQLNADLIVPGYLVSLEKKQVNMLIIDYFCTKNNHSNTTIKRL